MPAPKQFTIHEFIRVVMTAPGWKEELPVGKKQAWTLSRRSAGKDAETRATSERSQNAG